MKPRPILDQSIPAIRERVIAGMRKRVNKPSCPSLDAVLTESADYYVRQVESLRRMGFKVTFPS